jgi:hypothetical protein
MSHNREVRRLEIHLRVFLNVLSRYISYPLRLIHRLFHWLLQKYSRVTSTWSRLQPIHRDSPLDRVAGSSHSTLPQYNNQLQVPSPSGPSSNSSLPISSLSTAPPSSNHALQLPSSPPVEFQPFIPSEVKRYNNGLLMWASCVPSGF